jgi:hypothetical protein
MSNNRARVVRMAEAMGVLTCRRGRNGLTFARPTSEIRIGVLEALYGRSQGVVRCASINELDAQLERAVKVRKGMYGHSLRMAQYHLCAGNDARHEANRLWLLPSRPYRRVIAALAEAKAHLQMAARFQSQHEDSR